MLQAGPSTCNAGEREDWASVSKREQNFNKGSHGPLGSLFVEKNLRAAGNLPHAVCYHFQYVKTTYRTHSLQATSTAVSLV